MIQRSVADSALLVSLASPTLEASKAPYPAEQLTFLRDHRCRQILAISDDGERASAGFTVGRFACAFQKWRKVSCCD